IGAGTGKELPAAEGAAFHIAAALVQLTFWGTAVVTAAVRPRGHAFCPLGTPRCSTLAVALPRVPGRLQEPWLPCPGRPPENHSVHPIRLRVEVARGKGSQPRARKSHDRISPHTNR